MESLPCHALNAGGECVTPRRLYRIISYPQQRDNSLSVWIRCLDR